jgi:hypothetical protein
VLLGGLYLGSSAVFACAGFTRRGFTIVRSVVAAMGSFFLLSGLLVALAMGILGFPFEGRGWEGGAGARRLRRSGDGVRGVVALR